ncbi:MAG: nucleoside deaminase [Alphaproteobacteria bacterium]|nr:nucleoside deaminase [Alphaproteobacteria bacterium]
MIVSNFDISAKQIQEASERIVRLQNKLPDYIAGGSGPFLAAVYDERGHLIAETANSVVRDGCSHCHAEMNVIATVQKKLGTYDLSSHHLSLYVTAEPCLMCLGGIMWSGIEAVYYGVSSEKVEEITGFDEGFKPNWLDEFKKRHIRVCGQIEESVGEAVLKSYMDSHKKVYKPERT